jgi:hypothetical protein
MNKGIFVWSIFLFSSFSAGSGAAQASLSAAEIMNRNEDVRRVNDVYSSARLVTGGTGMTERVKEFIWWRKLKEDGTRFNTLTRFKLPAEIKGEGILFLEQDQDKNEVLMYLPAFKKIRRVESQQQSGSFMGSEFSYSDIAMPHSSDYKHQLVKEENCGTSQELKGISCFVIESLPVSDDVRERTGYSSTRAWVRADNFMVAKAEYKNLEGELSKRLEASEVKMVDTVKKKWMAHSLRIENVKNGHFTSLQFRQVKANQGIENAVFTTNNLARP